MKILALEFSSARRSVAVLAAEPSEGPPEGPTAPLRPAQPPVCVAETGGRNTHAFKLIQAALGQSGLDRGQIDCLAVGLGPGSYTGIRIALAIAQGWQLATGVKLLGISSVDCLAAQLHKEAPPGRYTILIDAQRNECYRRDFEVSPNGAVPLAPLRIVSLLEARAQAQAGQLVVGPELEAWFPHARQLFPDAATLAELALSRNDFVSGEQLEPIYLRPTSFVKAPPPRFPAA
jgi:tRNA threonylcarbamoyl adenosine modification protein YeaZ